MRRRVAVDEADGGIRAVFVLSYARLVTQMTALCANRGEAEAAVQDAFLEAVTHRSGFAAAESKEAWLRRVSVDVLRGRRRRSRLAAWLAPSRRGPTLDLGPQATEDHLVLVYALSRLSEPVRLCYVLRHVGGLSIPEIARELSVEEGAVKGRLLQARAQLGLHLELEEPGRV